MTEKILSPWGGFWRRILAFLVDCMVLGALCLSLGYLLYDRVAALGSMGRLIGLGFGVVYFGAGASPLLNGQSLGKRALGLKVIRWEGDFLSVLPAVARSFVVVAPIIFNGLLWPVSNPVMGWILAWVSVVLVFGLGLAQIVLLLLNGPDRRLVHDFLFGTVVVRKAVDAAQPVRPAAWKLFVVLGTVIAVGGGMLWVTHPFQGWTGSNLKDLSITQTALMKEPDVSSASVLQSKSVFRSIGGQSRTSETLQIVARLTRWPTVPEAKARRLAQLVQTTHAQRPKDGIVVVLTYGFDLGFGSSFRSYSTNFPEGPKAAPAAPSASTGRPD